MLHFSSSSGESLRKENLNKDKVEEAIRDEHRVATYGAITDSTIVLGHTEEGKALVVVLEGEDALRQEDVPKDVLMARVASPDEARLYEEHATDA